MCKKEMPDEKVKAVGNYRQASIETACSGERFPVGVGGTGAPVVEVPRA
jgi:hypothetical protein